MTQIKGLEAFCKKQGISVLGGDEFNLMEFLLAICAKTHWLAELSGRLSERISTLEKDSDEWGGCPRCGTNVHAGLSECPLCGFTLEGSLEEEKPEEVPPEKKPSRDTIKKPKPKTQAPAKNQPPDDLDEFMDDDPIEEMLEDEGVESEDDISEDEDADTGDEEDMPDEEDLAEDDLIVPETKLPTKVNDGRPRKQNACMTPERNQEKSKRREKLRKLLPKFYDNPGLALKLRYEDLLMMPGLLDYSKRPTTIGAKEQIQSWVIATLKKRSKPASQPTPSGRR